MLLRRVGKALGSSQHLFQSAPRIGSSCASDINSQFSTSSMKLAFRSGAFLGTLTFLTLASCRKTDETPAVPAKTDPAPVSAPTTADKESPAPAQSLPEMKEPAAPPSPVPSSIGTSQSASSEERDFFGTVGGQPVVANLTFTGEAGGTSQVKGWYYPESRGSSAKLGLEGSLKDGVLALNQVTEGKVTATFELRSETPNGKTFMGNCKVLDRAIPTKLTAR